MLHLLTDFVALTTCPNGAIGPSDQGQLAHDTALSAMMEVAFPLSVKPFHPLALIVMRWRVRSYLGFRGLIHKLG